MTIKSEFVRIFFQELQTVMLPIYEEVRDGRYVGDLESLQQRIADAINDDDSDTEEDDDAADIYDTLSEAEYDALMTLILLPSGYMYLNDLASFPQDSQLQPIVAPFEDDAAEVLVEYRKFLNCFSGFVNSTTFARQTEHVDFDVYVAGIRAIVAEERAKLNAELEAIHLDFQRKLDSTGAELNAELEAINLDFQRNLDSSMADFKLKISDLTKAKAEILEDINNKVDKVLSKDISIAAKKEIIEYKTPSKFEKLKM